MFGRGPKSFRLFRFLYHLPNFVRLAWRLFWDPRVPIYRKAILVIFEVLAIAFAIGYFLFLRLDFLPDILPILGYTDDRDLPNTCARRVAVHQICAARYRAGAC